MIEITVFNGKTRNKFYKLTIGENSNQACPVWISNEIGEGCGMNHEQLFDKIDDFFKEKF